MNDQGALVNKIAQSGLIVLDLEDYFPAGTTVEFDLSQYLYQGLVLREKDFRQTLKEHHWTEYADKTVALFCSSDAIIPQWAYMLVTSYLIESGAHVFYGDKESVEEDLLCSHLDKLDADVYADKRVVIKGCGKIRKSGKAYVSISKKLLPVVRSLMFGEPCSTVPVYKKKG